jgi:hypothetical protein
VTATTQPMAPVSAPHAEAGSSAQAAAPALSPIPAANHPPDSLLSSAGGRMPPAPAASSSTAPSSDNSPLPTARLVDGAQQAEMHIDLRTQSFGSVQVHTSVRDSQVGVMIGSEKGDLRAFLTAEVPSLQSAFSRQDLHFDNIRFLGQSPGPGAGLAGGTDSQPRSHYPGRPAPSGSQQSDPLPPTSGGLEHHLGSPVGLNVHA